MKQVFKLIGTLIIIFVLFALSINIGTGRFWASGYKLSPSFWKSEEISKRVKKAYLQAKGEGKVSSGMLFETIVPYLDHQEVSPTEGRFNRVTPCKGIIRVDAKPQRTYNTFCLVLRDGAKILYNNWGFDPERLSFYVAPDGPRTSPENTYQFWLEQSGEVVAEKDIELITLY